MPASTLNGLTQIRDGSIIAAKLAASLALPTTQLAEGADFIKRTGAVAFTANQSMGGFRLTNVADAANAQDAVNLRTLQAFVNGFGASKGARMIFTTNVALTGLQNADGVTGAAGDIVWLNAQSSASQNGFWTMSAGAWTRPAMWAAASTQKSFLLFIEQGTLFGDTKWTVAADNIVVDTGVATAVQDTTGSTYTNGNGLSLTGSAFAVKTGNGIAFDGSQNVTIALNGSSLNLSATGLKIADGTPGQLMLANASNAATFTTLSGDATVSATGVMTVNNAAGTGFVKYANFVSNETPTGAINGTNTTFTLANTPQVNSLELFLNGQLLEPGAGNDYTISGTTITTLFAPLSTPVADKLRAYYVR